MPRARLDDEDEIEEGGVYFDDVESIKTFTTGCNVLDCALGGGWARRRMINIVGDKSTGKTLLAIEAAANFTRCFADGLVKYREVESAFDEDYAQSVGFPLDRCDLKEGLITVEEVNADIEKTIEENTDNVPIMYVIDSLDALSDDAEQNRDITDGTYGTKAKVVSEFFRRQNGPMSRANITLLVISQIRANIGVTFGAKYTRSGGKALDFYASQIVWLAQVSKIKRVRKGITRITGVNIKADVKKNKVGKPFRQCDFPIIFDYGMDDLIAGIDFLKTTKRLDAIGLSVKAADALLRKAGKLSQEDYDHERSNITEAVREVWAEIEAAFRPPRKKYV